MLLFGKISSMAGNLKMVALRLCLFLALFAAYRVKPVYNSHQREMNIIYRVTAIIIQVNFVEKYKATENFGKLSGGSNEQGDRLYKAVYTGLTVSYFKVLRP